MHQIIKFSLKFSSVLAISSALVPHSLASPSELLSRSPSYLKVPNDAFQLQIYRLKSLNYLTTKVQNMGRFRLF